MMEGSVCFGTSGSLGTRLSAAIVSEAGDTEIKSVRRKTWRVQPVVARATASGWRDQATKGHTADDLASRGDEGRGNLR